MERQGEQNNNENGNQNLRSHSPPPNQINTVNRIIDKSDATNAPGRPNRNRGFNTVNSRKKLNFQ